VLFGLVFVEIISSINRRPQRSLTSQSLGKYWQLNHNNKHAKNNRKIKNNKKTLVTDDKEKPKIRQHRQKVTTHGSAYPKEITQQYTPATHTEAMNCQGVLCSPPSLSLTTKGSWMCLKEKVASLSSSLWRQYPTRKWKEHHFEHNQLFS